ncbi:hypothetical protein ACEPAG_8352 [Sanghuangporus baumii]
MEQVGGKGAAGSSDGMAVSPDGRRRQIEGCWNKGKAAGVRRSSVNAVDRRKGPYKMDRWTKLKWKAGKGAAEDSDRKPGSPKGRRRSIERRRMEGMPPNPPQ